MSEVNFKYENYPNIEKSNFYLDKIKPDAFFILGDTNSTLSSLIAKRKKIPKIQNYLSE